jgi:hypothetical protein
VLNAIFIAAEKLGLAAPLPAAVPTQADKALAARFEALAKKLDGGRGREVVNLTRDDSPEAQGWIGFSKDNTGAMALRRLKGELDATDAQLAAARAAYGRVVAKLEQVEAFPPNPIYPIARRSGAVTIDGDIQAGEWKGAKPVDLHWQFSRDQPAAGPVATCRMMWDDENLYAAFVVPDAEVIGNEALDNDKNTYLYDCVELFLMPEARFPAYWEINITPKKEVVDRLVMKKTRGWFGYADLTEDIQGIKVGAKTGVKVSTPPDAAARPGYTLEVAIPWSQLPNMSHGPKTGDTIHGIMAWSDVNGKLDYANQKYFSQVPTVAGYQSVWEFQEMKLMGKKGWFR